MKNNFFQKIYFFLFVLVFVFAALVYYQVNSSSPIASKDSIEQNTHADVYVAYAISEQQTNNQFSEISVYLYDIATKTNRKIYAVVLQNEFHDPLFRKFQNSILIDNAEPDKNVRIDLNGKILEESIDKYAFFRYANTLFSPTNQRYAFPQPHPTTEGLFNFYIMDQNGKESILPGGGESDESGIVFPLHWSSDENFLYTYRQRGTDGYIPGVEHVNIRTLQKERIQPVDNLQLVQYTFDAFENIYAVSLKEIEMFDWKNTTHIFKVTPENDTQTFELKNSKIHKLLTVDPAGKFLPYISQDAGGSSWVYDFQNNSEIRISTDDILDSPNSILWHEDRFFFLEMTTDPTTRQIEQNLKYYETSSGNVLEVLNFSKNLSPSQNISQFIGYFISF